MPASRLATLRAIWTRSFDTVTGPQAQACEYGQLMGIDALRRQWQGGWGRSWKKIEHRLGHGAS